MDEFEQSDVGKETNDSHDHNTFYQIAKHYKERENASIKNCKCDIIPLVFVMKLGRRMTEIFSVGLQNIDKGLKA